MDYLPLILTISSVHAVPDTSCNRLKISDKFYDREVLWVNLRRPYNLIVHKPSNTLFFSYSGPETFSDLDFQLAFYNINTKENQIIAGIRGGCALAIDSLYDEIYMGGSEGIYKYNMLTGLADFYKEKGKNIWALFHRKNLFYISYPDQKLYMEFDGKFSRVKEFEDFEIDHFYVTEKDEIFFANKTGFYRYDNENGVTDTISELITVRQIMEDFEDNLYIVTNFGIYSFGKNIGLKKILDLKNVFGLAFDKDNSFLLSDETSIMKLIPSAQGCINKEPHW